MTKNVSFIGSAPRKLNEHSKIGSNFDSTENEENKMSDSKATAMEYEEIARMRRGVVGILRKLERQNGISTTNSVGKRINKLSREDLIPPIKKECMHFICNARNRAEYNELLPDVDESVLLRTSWSIIENWWIDSTEGRESQL